ncbi:MAG: response regulator, partial [Vulcanimicrobiaceae bacterium]
MTPIRVVLVEDHALTRMGLRTSLSAVGIHVVAEVADGIEGLATICAERPDVAVVDIGLPGMDGIALTQRVRVEAPSTRIVILTMIDEEEDVLAALAAGADAYCLKSTDAERIVEAVRMAAAGGAYFDPRIAHVVLRRFTGSASTLGETPLTARETEILRLIAEGVGNTDIASHLHLGLG